MAKGKSIISVLGIAGVDNARIVRRIGSLPEREMQALSATMARVLGIV
jgi:hypothetical protein